MAKCLLILLSWCCGCMAANPQHDTFMTMQENAQGVPANLLRAISNVESGRSVAGGVTPWPWTINVEGRGYVFKTKAEAIKAVEKFQRQGAKSIDVGIMQINLHHHPGAFGNLEEAFDPQLNIAYGAKFLKQLYEQHKTWNKAVGYYHSATPKFHNAYKQKVLNHWVQLSKNSKAADHKASGKLSNNTQLAQTVLRFDDVANLGDASSGAKAGPQTSIRPFAKIKRVYYALDGSIPSRSRSMTKAIAKKSKVHQLEVASSRQFYSLD